MTTFAIGGQGSGDFRETSGRVQLLHVVTRNAQGNLTPDAFTQANPPIVTNPVAYSTTLATIQKVGVLGGTYAFSRPDFGNGYQGGPTLPGGGAYGTPGSYSTGQLPLGCFINDSIGNAFENTPGIASGKGPYISGVGSCLANAIYETKSQGLSSGPAVGTAITYSPGNKLYVSANGLITNNILDAYEYQANTGTSFAGFATVVGVVKVAPDANSSLLVYDTRI
jgi:hypothetical protein